MKKDVFEDENVILHETELRMAKKEMYKVMRRKEKRELFWDNMGKMFNKKDITVFVAVINPDEYKTQYNSRFLNDEYFVCLEVIVENFVHFLEKNNAVGSIYLESQNPKADNRLTNYFHQLVKRGTRCMNNHAVRTQIVSFNFYQKSDLNVGLQIADFIPNTMKKYAYAIENKKPCIENEIASCLYDGQVGATNIFGLKKC